MKRTAYLFICAVAVPFAVHASELSDAVDNVRNSCAGISSEMNEMKKMAGINTAITGVGTVAGGVALGTGIAKVTVDKESEELEKLIAELDASGAKEIKTTGELYSVLADMFGETGVPAGAEIASSLRKKQQEQTKKSKGLGNVRTGTMAGAAATNIAGAVIAGTNRVRGDLKTQINNCIAATKILSNVRMQARMNGGTADSELQQADKIVSGCSGWEIVDLSKIDNRSTGATVSSAVGATTGIVGTITSASANAEATRADNSDAGKQKEKNLNTASNVLAGTTTIASGAATVFNATQIAAIKRAVAVADECEEALGIK